MLSNSVTTILAFIVVLSILVFVHELGHFSMAKLFKVRVEEFAIGFPPRITGIQRGGTLYAVNAIPLGGYVRMMGENGADSENPDSFGYKPWWQRAIILMAGPVMNMTLAVVLFFAASAWLGVPVADNAISQVSSGSPAQKAGIVVGDRILAVDGKKVDPSHVGQAIDRHRGQLTKLTIERITRMLIVTLVPRKTPPVGQGPIGVGLAFSMKTYPAGVSLKNSFGQLGQTIMAIPNLISNIAHANTTSVSGPIGIAHATGEVAMGTRQHGLGELFAFMALISASLGVFNLLPIPALDGGRLVFVVLSGFRRKGLDPQVEGLIHLTGMAVLIVLVLLVSYQDIVNWAGGQ